MDSSQKTSSTASGVRSQRPGPFVPPGKAKVSAQPNVVAVEKGDLFARSLAPVNIVSPQTHSS